MHLSVIYYYHVKKNKQAGLFKISNDRFNLKLDIVFMSELPCTCPVLSVPPCHLLPRPPL